MIHRSCESLANVLQIVQKTIFTGASHSPHNNVTDDLVYSTTLLIDVQRLAVFIVSIFISRVIFLNTKSGDQQCIHIAAPVLNNVAQWHH